MNNIFDNIESEKKVELNDRLWQRVEDKLDVNKYKSKSNNYRWIAACAVLLIVAGLILQQGESSKRSKYRVTDFSIDSNDGIIPQSIDERTTLKKWYDELVDCTLKRDKYSC